MKKILIAGLLTSLCGCGGSDNVSSAALLPSVAVATPTVPGPSDALIAAYDDGVAEVQLSQLALQRANSLDVQMFAQRMITDHAVLNDDIARLARQRNIALPTIASADAQAALARLQGLSGSDFDRAYLDTLVAMHDKDAAQLRQQAVQSADDSLRQLAALAYPFFKEHLAAAEELDGLINPPAFLASVYQDGLAEIQLGQLALQKATRGDVKAFAQRMIDDHAALNNRIAPVAQRRGITLPANPALSQQAEATDLARFSGIDFDKAYMDANVIAHAKDVAALAFEIDRGTDPDATAIAQTALPILTQHDQQARDIDQAIQPTLLYVAAQDNLAALQQAFLATVRNADGNFADIAVRLSSEQGAIRNQLAGLAQQRQIALPVVISPELTAAFSGLVMRGGADFEAAFRTTNANSLSRQIDVLSQYAQSGDADLQAFATHFLNVLKGELAVLQGTSTPPDAGA